MALVTYTLLSGLASGLQNRFHPEVLGYTLSKALGVVVTEFLVIRSVSSACGFRRVLTVCVCVGQARLLPARCSWYRGERGRVDRLWRLQIRRVGTAPHHPDLAFPVLISRCSAGSSSPSSPPFSTGAKSSTLPSSFTRFAQTRSSWYVRLPTHQPRADP